MNLSPEIQKQLIEWVKQERTLSEIQKSLEEAGVKMTYMEVRFLLDDLQIDLPEKEPEPEVEAEDDQEGHAEEDDSSLPGKVSVEVDKITRPGAVVSGNAQFSDGVKATWALDQTGRLMLDAGQEGYQPPAEDIQAFQDEIRKALQGF